MQDCRGSPVSPPHLTTSPISGTWTHTKGREVNGAQVIKVGKAKEAKVFPVGSLNVSGLVKLNDSVMEGGLHKGEELRDIGLPCQILGVPLWECKAGHLHSLSESDDPLTMRADSFHLLGDTQ